LRIDVLPCADFPWIPPLDDKIVVIIDVLRATSTIITALANGCESVIPAADKEEALRLRVNEPGSLLGGEINARIIEGFDLGNSPLEYTPEKVGGRRIILTTTNGTKAIRAAAGARLAFMAAFLNIESVAHTILRYLEKYPEIKGIVILCAGTGGRFDLPDILCAGMLIDTLGQEIILNDLGYAAQMLYNNSKDDLTVVIKNSEHGKFLLAGGFEKDVIDCSAVNILPIVPVLSSGEIVWGTS